MIAIRVVSGVALVMMVVTLASGFVAGDFGEEGRQILDLAWGRVTLVDLYVGLLLLAGWIALRERGPLVLVWLVALIVLGNLAAAAYALAASLRSESPAEFLTGTPS